MRICRRLSVLAAFAIGSSEAFAFMSFTSNRQRCNKPLKLNSNSEENEHERSNDAMLEKVSTTRRAILSTAAFLGTTLLAQPSYAGEVGAQINKAVTTSDLGISVRRSVVKGAQMMDKLDGQWEKFSDDNGLGAERFKQQGRLTPKVVPDPKPLNVEMATQILQLSDDAFISSTAISSNALSSQIQQVDGLVRKSFERSGLDLSGEMTAKVFNYYCYVHFKAYCDILVDNKLAFNRKLFEGTLG